MAKSIIWSQEASEDLVHILEYWTNRNKSTIYSIKLLKLIYESIDLIVQFPILGRKTNFKDIKNIRIRDYLIFYRDLDDCLSILCVWDNRQDPKKIQKRMS
jgi:toxin YoeB